MGRFTWSASGIGGAGSAADLVVLLIALWIFGAIGAAIVVGVSIIAYAIRGRG